MWKLPWSVAGSFLLSFRVLPTPSSISREDAIHSISVIRDTGFSPYSLTGDLMDGVLIIIQRATDMQVKKAFPILAGDCVHHAPWTSPPNGLHRRWGWTLDAVCEGGDGTSARVDIGSCVRRWWWHKRQNHLITRPYWGRSMVMAGRDI